MRVRALKEFLSTRGVGCEGCVEKADWVNLAVSSAAMPTLPPSPSPSPSASSDMTTEEWNNLMASLQSSRGGGKDESPEMKKMRESLEKAGIDLSNLDMS
eukprot:contig_30094_g7370